MSSHAAAAISAMITSQVYPQLHYPPPPRAAARPEREEREQESEAPGVLAKGTSQGIGSFQIIFGAGILLTLLIIFIASALTLPSIVISVSSSIVYITNGAMSCFRWRCRARVKRRRVVIRVTIIMNALGVLLALTSIVIYCLSFSDCYYREYYCTYDPKIGMIILMFLSILELGLAIMAAVFVWDHLKDIDDLDLVAFSREGWRDGERGDGNEKPLRATSPSASL